MKTALEENLFLGNEISTRRFWSPSSNPLKKNLVFAPDQKCEMNETGKIIIEWKKKNDLRFDKVELFSVGFSTIVKLIWWVGYIRP